MKQAQVSAKDASPIRLTERHGYRFDGDRVALNAELDLMAGAPEKGWSLELWARAVPLEQASTSADLARQAHRVATTPLAVATPLRSQTHLVEVMVDAHLPTQSRNYTMFLVLLDDKKSVVALSEYPRSERFAGPTMTGNVGYEIFEAEVLISIDRIENSRSSDNLSGTLLVELAAVQHALDREQGATMASFELPPLAGGYEFSSVSRRVPWTEPLAGRYTVVLRLKEYTSSGYMTRDQRVFDLELVGQRTDARLVDQHFDSTDAAPPVVLPHETEGTQSPATTPRPLSRKPAAPAKKATAVQTASRGRVSLERGSLEEFAKVPGLTVKIAKEIIKSRPFSSLDDLLKVKGIGKKSLVKLRDFLEL